jgi:hypothetical protein
MTLTVLSKIIEIIVKSYSLIVCWIGYFQLILEPFENAYSN